MSLESRNDPDARCTRFRQVTCELVWKPEQHYVAGTQVEHRCRHLRALERAGGLICASPVFVTVL
jgi:hypothetical protein